MGPSKYVHFAQYLNHYQFVSFNVISIPYNMPNLRRAQRHGFVFGLLYGIEVYIEENKLIIITHEDDCVHKISI